MGAVWKWLALLVAFLLSTIPWGLWPARDIVARAQGEAVPEPGYPLCRQPSGTGCPLDPGHWVHELLARPDDVHRYAVRVDFAPTTLWAALSELPTDYDLHLVDPGGNVIATSNREEREDDFITFSLPEIGEYSLYVTSGRGGATLGGWYKLAVDIGSPPPLSDPLLGTITVHAWAGAEPVEGIELVLDGAISAVTDRNGAATFSDVAPGYHVLLEPLTGPRAIFAKGLCCPSTGKGLHLHPGQHYIDAIYYFRRNVQTLAPQNDAVVADPVLRWESVPGAIVYKVTLLRLDPDTRRVLRTAATVAPEYPVPAGTVQPGRIYPWRVEAYDRLGHKIASTDDRSAFRTPG